MIHSTHWGRKIHIIKFVCLYPWEGDVHALPDSIDIYPFYFLLFDNLQTLPNKFILINFSLQNYSVSFKQIKIINIFHMISFSSKVLLSLFFSFYFNHFMGLFVSSFLIIIYSSKPCTPLTQARWWISHQMTRITRWMATLLNVFTWIEFVNIYLNRPQLPHSFETLDLSP